MIESTLAAPAGSSPGAVRCERRASVRYPCCFEARARLQAPAGVVSWWANVVDLSAGGLRLLVCPRFEPGELLQVDLHGSHRAYRVMVRVVHASPQPGGSCLIGAEFVQGQLSEAEVQALL
jgi:hypothetical protein